MADHEGEERLDRQLRLWGKRGQNALASATVLCVGANASGTETLKNLVLPGIGAFGIVDDRPVTENDIKVVFT